jgi:paraquat-inducible protein B
MLKAVAHADRVLDSFEQAKLPQQASATLAHLDQVLTSAQRQLDGADLGALSKQARATMARVDAVLARVDGAGGLVASVQRATDAVGDFATGSPAMQDELVATLRDMREAAASFQRLTEALERDPDMLLKGRGGGQ